MFVVAVFGLLAGGWLLDSAIQNRNPITSALDVIRNPATARQSVASSNGSAFTVDHPVNAPSATGAAAGNTVGYSGTVENGTTQANSGAAGVLAYARAQIGKPYKWGATGPGSFDCSGLVYMAFKSVGVTLPRTTATMLAATKAGKTFTTVSKADLKVGDLVFPDAGHVQIYSGGGKVVEAPRAGLNVREVNMWGFLTAVRYKGVTDQNQVR